MKKILVLLFTITFIAQAIGAATIVKPPLKASEITIPISSTGKSITMQDLSTISLKDFEALSGKKLSLANRVMFKSAQRKIRSSINGDGTVSNKKVEKFYRKYGSDGESGFNIGGFALGFLLGLIGVLISYIINNDNNANRHKWTWIGFGTWVVLLLLFSI